MLHLVPPAFRWKLRRFMLPIHKNNLVLEVGSGGNPYPRSNILLDKYIETGQRHFKPLTIDRPCFICDAQKLPFKDKAFDFVIAAHVLEHVDDPQQFLLEIQRVAKAGYIEVPNVVFERLNPYHDHQNEISLSNDNILLIRKKIIPKPDPFLVDEYERTSHDQILKLIKKNPYAFHVRYFWCDSINYKMCEPCTVQPSHVLDEFTQVHNQLKPAKPKNFVKIRTALVILIRMILTQLLTFFYRTHRKSAMTKSTLLALLKCPICDSISLDICDSSCVCNDCKNDFPLLGFK